MLKLVVQMAYKYGIVAIMVRYMQGSSSITQGVKDKRPKALLHGQHRSRAALLS